MKGRIWRDFERKESSGACLFRVEDVKGDESLNGVLELGELGGGVRDDQALQVNVHRVANLREREGKGIEWREELESED